MLSHQWAAEVVAVMISCGLIRSSSSTGIWAASPISRTCAPHRHGARQTSSPAAPSQACGPRLDWEQGERSLHQARLVGVGDTAQDLLHWNPFDVVVLVVMIHR